MKCYKNLIYDYVILIASTKSIFDLTLKIMCHILRLNFFLPNFTMLSIYLETHIKKYCMDLTYFDENKKKTWIK